MSDYAPPTGPPPPRVPEGWKAVWNDQFKQWFYVNLHTKESTWDKPTDPASRPGESGHHDGGMPPSYTAGSSAPDVSDTKKQPLESNNPYNASHGGTETGARAGAGGANATETDEQLARRLQAEYDSQPHSQQPTHQYGNGSNANRGQSDSYYGSVTSGGNGGHGPQPPGFQGGYPGGPQQYSQQQSTDKGSGSGGGGLFGKLKSKLSGGSSSSRPQQGGYGGGGYGGGYGGYPPQQQQQYGGGYGGYGGGGYPQQQRPMYMQQQQPARKGGMGVGGAAALGVGGGLVGGMLLANALDDDHDYQEGYQDGQQADDGGGDYGGGGDDFGGGDF